MFLDMSGTGEPHRGLGRLFVRKRTRWPHLWARTPWSGNSRLFKPEPTTPQNKHGAPVAFDGAHAARRRRGRHRHRPRRPCRFHLAPGRAPSWCRCRCCPGSPTRRGEGARLPLRDRRTDTPKSAQIAANSTNTGALPWTVAYTDQDCRQAALLGRRRRRRGRLLMVRQGCT